ncbi:MAG: diguanylate cyclase [Planctomycetaceae bacterium]|nr:diguanylate cyclase [Planctomycetaceae bacterium]
MTSLQTPDIAGAPVEPLVRSSHPMDSSRILLSMMALARQGELALHDGTNTLDSVVARPVLKRLISALNFRDAATLQHSRRVALLSVGMAQQLGWDGRHLRVLEVAGLLHDVGKIGVPDNILLKPGKLSAEEAELMSLHYNIGADLLQACRVDKEVVQIVLDSHAYYDAHIDASQRTGADIHLGARILAVADAYDSLTHDQVFRIRKSHGDAMNILHGDAGTKFDGNVVAALDRWVEKDGWAYIKGEGQAADDVESSAPQNIEASLEAGSLCHIFSYLYILESLYDGFYVLDSDLRFAVWSSGAEKLLGRICSQVLGTPWSSRLFSYSDNTGKRLTDRECPVQEVMETCQPACRTLNVQQRGGSWIEAELQCFPLIDYEGKLLGVAEIFRDISRSKRNAPQFRELKLAASRDALTGVSNRGELEKHLKRMLAEYSKGETDMFSVIFLDIDHFKAINDTHGHGVGDRVLIAVARLMQSELYSGELVARYGGEEFVVLCPSTDIDSAMRKAERLRSSLAETSIGDSVRLKVTASLGVSQIDASDSMETLLHRADTALYNAKEGGRNRICKIMAGDCHDPDQEPVEEKPKKGSEFVFESHFTTCMVASMGVYKVSGFVNELDAELKEATAERVVMQIGQPGFFKGWGNHEKKQPVNVMLSFGEPEQQSTKAASRRVLVTVNVTPIGRPPSADQFQIRAKKIYELTRNYFAAD